MKKEARYRKVYPRIWRHKDFIPLEAEDKTLVLYCLSGPQTNRIGFYAFSPGQAAEELRMTLPSLRARLARICDLFEWRFDAESRVMLIPSWWEWNRPENKNVLTGALKDLMEVPGSALYEQWANVTRNVCQTYRVTFPEPSPERSPIQEQEQDQEQEDPPVAPQGGAEPKNGHALRAIPMRPAQLRRRAEDLRAKVWMGCLHDPPCAGYEPCIARIVTELRAAQDDVASATAEAEAEGAMALEPEARRA